MVSSEKEKEIKQELIDKKEQEYALYFPIYYEEFKKVSSDKAKYYVLVSLWSSIPSSWLSSNEKKRFNEMANYINSRPQFLIYGGGDPFPLV